MPRRKRSDTVAEKDRIRKHQFKLSLLDVENELLKQKSSEYGLSRTEYLRQLIVFVIEYGKLMLKLASVKDILEN